MEVRLSFHPRQTIEILISKQKIKLLNHSWLVVGIKHQNLPSFRVTSYTTYLLITSISPTVIVKSELLVLTNKMSQIKDCTN